MAAMLTSETGNTEKVVKYINEARSMGITVLPPDVNSSDLNFTPVGEQIRFGLAAIKNVGENTVKGILAARETLGRFTSFFEFCESIDTRLLNKRVLESLIRAGAHGWAGRSPRADDRRDRPRHGARAETAARDAKAASTACSAAAAQQPAAGSAAGNSAGRGRMARARTPGRRIRHARLLYFRPSAR